MVFFKSDYMCGAVPEIMAELERTNMECTPGYGQDIYCKAAEKKILEACGLEQGQVKFVIGGTEANSVVVDGLLGKCQGVLAAETSHINVHEAGTIEAFGHKVLTLPTADGKISASDIDQYVASFFADDTWEHMVEPGMVYISFPTELGTIYTRKELEDIYRVCHKHHIPLYIDGARLGYGLASSASDVTLKDIAALSDIFYIGGTKQGALFGEAIVSKDPNIIPRITSLIKQHGAMLAKGRLLGLQFLTLFTDGLYMKYSRKAVAAAQNLRKLMLDMGYPLFVDSPTNQQFFVLPNNVIDRLWESVRFELWGPRGPESTPVRFVTSWATADSDIKDLAVAISKASSAE